MSVRVVFIDDEVDLCETYEELLSSDRVEVRTFCESEKAEEYFKSETAHVCFIDYRMPLIDGFEMRRRIPDSVDCYLITGELTVASHPGFKGVLPKPFEPEEFDRIISSYEKSGSIKAS